MRPRGEVRQAIGRAVEQFDASRAFTWRDVAHSACVGLEAARHTVQNMARCGELLVVGETPVPGVRRPMVCYVPVSPAEPAAQPGAALEQAIRGWADFR
jgi:hypothetical protein